MPTQPTMLEMFRCKLNIFATTKDQRRFKSTLASIASREACRRAAVKPRPTCMSLYAPARLRRAEVGAGLQPCQTGEPPGPWPSGGKTQASSHVPLCPCTAPPRRSGCRASALLDGAVGVEEGELFEVKDVGAILRGALGQNGHFADHVAAGLLDQLFDGLE